MARQHRVLIAQEMDASVNPEDMGHFLDVLREINCSVDFRICKDDIPLTRFGVSIYDTIVVMAGKQCFGAGAADLATWLDEGGNAIVFTVEKDGKLQESIFRHLQLRASASSMLKEWNGSTVQTLRRVVAPVAISRAKGPLSFQGGFGIIERPNDFRIPLVTGDATHVSSRPSVTQLATGFELLPIYALQGRNGGRVVIVHSHDFAVDARFEMNGQFLRDIGEWVTHYKSAYRLQYISHSPAPEQYHVMQNITIEARLDRTIRGEWVPVESPVLQCEVFMLGVFVRRHMALVGPGLFRETLMLPDRPGNFKIKVFTELGVGVLNAREETAIAIRPLRIRERERFLPSSRPYYLAMILGLVGVFVAAVHFLYHGEEGVV